MTTIREWLPNRNNQLQVIACLGYHKVSIRDLELKEISAFAPRTTSLSAPLLPSTGEAELVIADSSFPLMKLPIEIRLMIYEQHFLQGGETREGEPDCPAGNQCWAKIYNLNVPVRMLWTVSKQLYYEAMPVYFRTKDFRFFKASKVINFFQTIGPYQRPFISRITLHMHWLGDYSYIFKQISQWLLLEHLSLIMIAVLGSDRSLMENPAKEGLFKIRNLKSVSVEFLPLPDGSPGWVDQEEFSNAIQILKQPYHVAVIKQRAAQGILQARPARKSCKEVVCKT